VLGLELEGVDVLFGCGWGENEKTTRNEGDAKKPKQNQQSLIPWNTLAPGEGALS
jgi:hypothetical protein